MRRMILAAAVALPLAGCITEHYEISMTPTDGGVERRVACWAQDHDPKAGGPRELPKEALERIAGLYGKRLTDKGAVRQEFQGVFKEKLPADQGDNAGYWISITSDLGSATAYSERLSGESDPAGRLQERLASADTLADILGGWLATAMKDDPGLPGFRQFVEGQFRRDLRNLALYMWMAGAADGADKGSESNALFARALHLMREGGYVEVADLGLWSRAVDEPGPEGTFFMMAIARRVLARKMGLEDERKLPASLAFLADAAKARQSLSEYTRKTKAYADFVKRQSAPRPAPKAVNAAEAKPPEPVDFLGHLMDQALLPDLDLSGDDLRTEVRCASDQEPVYTNGQWDSKARQVQWKCRRSKTLAPYCYALWATPDPKRQEARFGRVFLSGKNLVQYILWRQGLTDAEAAKWEDFLAGLAPGGDLRKKIEAVRLVPLPVEQKQDAPPPSDRFDAARNILLQALDGR